MCHVAAPELLVAPQRHLAALVVEVDGPARGPDEVLGADRSPRDERDCEAVGDDGTELLDQVQGQGWSPRTGSVEEADLWVEADGLECTHGLGEHQPVVEAQQGVDLVARWAPGSRREAELRP